MKLRYASEMIHQLNLYKYPFKNFTRKIVYFEANVPLSEHKSVTVKFD